MNIITSIKSLLSITFILFLQNVDAKEIYFEPKGIMDKPLPTIKIKVGEKNYETGPFFHYTFYVSKKEYRTIRNTVKNNKRIDIPKHVYPYGSYIISSKKLGRTKLYELNGKEESSHYFYELLNILESNSSLYLKIEYLYERLHP